MPELEDIKYNEICISLQSENKFTRKQALQEILNNFIDSIEELDEKHWTVLWEIFHRPVVRILHDQIEACRGLALEILKKFLLHLPCSEKNIVYVIPIMTKRLACQELIEQSEEVRLKCIVLLRAIVQKYEEKLSTYFEDLAKILIRTVTDKYPNVKKESCHCVCELAGVMPSTFYSKSEIFIQPILFNISHQHYKIRMTTINTIGEVLLAGNSKSMEVVAGPLAERLFDQSAAIRTAVVEVAGKWMTELKDRYSWWYKLLPLLLTGINDVVPDIRNKANSLWLAVGEQYMKENETDKKFKEQMDFLPEDLEHYPPNIIRPNLGCRTIVHHNFSKLIGAIIRELNDWMADIKVRAAQLLCILALNIEENVATHIKNLLVPMYRACNDQDRRVVENVELAAEYMGYFVPPKIFLNLVMPTLEECVTAGHLKILSAILRGSPREDLAVELPIIGEFLQNSKICRNQKAKYQMELLSCCESLLNICKEDCSPIFDHLFKTIFTILSISVESIVEEDAKILLELLITVEHLENLNQLFDKYIPTTLTSFEENPESWTISSYDFQICQACLTHAKSTTYKNLNLIHPIFEKIVSANEDKKVKLKQYILLSDYLQQWDKPLEQIASKAFIDFSNIILEKMIIPGLGWTAGRSAEAIRTASVCCLCALLNKIMDCCKESNITCSDQEKCFISIEHFGWLFEILRPILISQMEDDASKIRLHSLQAMCLVINIAQELSYITEEHIHKISPEILTRLEDSQDEVRLAAIEALKEIWKVLPDDYDHSFYYVHIEYAYEKMLIHLDDPAEIFQKQTLDCLMNLAKIHPEILIEKIEKSRINFINQKALEQLIQISHDYLKLNGTTTERNSQSKI